MEFFHDVKVDWLGKKWYFLAFSLIFSVAGIAKMSWNWVHTVEGMHSPVPLSVDFRGGTQVEVRFQQAPDLNAIRAAVDATGIHDSRITTFGEPANREVLISLPERMNENTLDTGRQEIETDGGGLAVRTRYEAVADRRR